MDVRSLAFRTDLALLTLGGSVVTDHGDHLVVRTPDNPTFWWGNFLLLAAPPTVPELDGWLDRFAAEHPGAQHVALGFDGTSPAGAEALIEHLQSPGRGFTVETTTAMTAVAVHPPPRPNQDVTVHTLETDEDWEQSVAVRLACDADETDVDHGPADQHRHFVTTRTGTYRRLVEDGNARWFGGFLGDRLVSQLGLVRADGDVARFQSVETVPEARGQGIAGTLVHHASQVGLTEMDARTLVMCADPDYLAIRLYRSVGFRDTETQLQATRRPVHSS